MYIDARVILQKIRAAERNTIVEEIRLNKYLSEAGVCSRREADRLIEQGKVLVDGRTAVMGMKVRPDQEIQVGKQIIGGRREERVLLAVYKPPGVICTTDRREKRNIVDYVGYPARIYPIGRLDKGLGGSDPDDQRRQSGEPDDARLQSS